MNAITMEVFGWLTDDRIEQLRADIRTTTGTGARRLIDAKLVAGLPGPLWALPLTVEEFDKLLSELIVRRLKDSKEKTLA
jgi:hypothetical protein